MSHYSVLVISTKGVEDVDAQLAPFNENLELPRHEVEVDSESELERFVEYYTEKYPNLIDKTAEELYKLYGAAWNGDCWEFQPDGSIKEYSTYNSKAKWDWYEVGGRWAARLMLKPGIEPIQPINFSWGWDEESKLKVLSQGRCDKAFMKDIDWEGMRSPEKYDKASRFWELYIDGQEPVDDRERKMVEGVFYSPEYLKERYSDRNTYARVMTDFSTYAVLKDGEWFAPGDMGWFGCSTESDEEGLDWDLKYYERFLKDLPENALLTVVDCHI